MHSPVSMTVMIGVRQFLSQRTRSSLSGSCDSPRRLSDSDRRRQSCGEAVSNVHHHCRAERPWLGDRLRQFFGPGHQYATLVKRLGEHTPLRIDEAQSSTDSDVGVLDGFEHGIDLSGKAANEFGLVVAVYVEPLVRLKPLADVSLFNLAFVALGIDDPDARC